MQGFKVILKVIRFQFQSWMKPLKIKLNILCHSHRTRDVTQHRVGGTFKEEYKGIWCDVESLYTFMSRGRVRPSETGNVLFCLLDETECIISSQLIS